MSTTSELIERLKTDLGGHETLMAAAAARLSELERENAALREALKPFAAQMPNLTWDDFIRARAALTAQEKK
jgi:hypothetical protein